MPLIISAPHGGDDNPSELPDRTNTSTYTVTTAKDLYTANLARAIRTACTNRYGRYPHVIICNVDRSKVDCNREILEGAQNNTNTQTVWKEFHAYINIARQQVSNTYGRGLYIDLHGHGHPIQKNEIGYVLSDSDMFKPAFSTTDDDESSIHALSVRSRQSFTDVVRGELSLGSLLEKRKYPCVPSVSSPNPGVSNGATNAYFNGGYNIQTYGTSSANGGTIDAIQIECNYTNVRAKSSTSSYSEDVAVRANFATSLVASLEEYFKYHLEMTLDTQATPPASVNSFSDKTILEDELTSTSSITLASASNTLWGDSSNTNIVDASSFIFGGSGTSRNLVVRPRANAYGSNVMVMVYQQATNGGVGTGWYYLNVDPVNDAPIFPSVADRTINPGVFLSIPASATDVEGTLLEYALVSGPEGCSVDSSTGVVTWRPKIATSGAAYPIVIKATEEQEGLSSTLNFQTTVNPATAPQVTPSWIAGAEGSSSPQLQLSINGQVGPDYIVLASEDLVSWASLSTNTPTVFPYFWSDTSTNNLPKRFYRLILGP